MVQNGRHHQSDRGQQACQGQVRLPGRLKRQVRLRDPPLRSLLRPPGPQQVHAGHGHQEAVRAGQVCRLIVDQQQAGVSFLFILLC